MPRKIIVPKKPAVSIIGAGRLGAALALALSRQGYTVQALVSRHSRDVHCALPGTPTLNVKQLKALPESELILIATPDDVISEVAEKMAAIPAITQQARGRATVLHTSGAQSSQILRPLANLGFHTGSLHPLVSVSDPISGAENLVGAYYCLEVYRVALRAARALVRDLGGHSFTIAAEYKALYHAAAVMASGHLTALFDCAVELLTRCGLKQQSAQRVLLPLVESAVKNLSTAEPGRALTGPFARGDLATVRKHLEALTFNDQPEALAIYRLLGQRSLKMTKRRNANRTAQIAAAIAPPKRRRR